MLGCTEVFVAVASPTVSVGSGVFVASGVSVGSGVFVGSGVMVCVGVSLGGTGVALGPPLV